MAGPVVPTVPFWKSMAIRATMASASHGVFTFKIHFHAPLIRLVSYGLVVPLKTRVSLPFSGRRQVIETSLRHWSSLEPLLCQQSFKSRFLVWENLSVLHHQQKKIIIYFHPLTSNVRSFIPPWCESTKASCQSPIGDLGRQLGLAHLWKSHKWQL